MAAPGDPFADDAVGFTSSSALAGTRRQAAEPAAPEAQTSLYVGYALILLTVPTFGVAAAIGFVRDYRRPVPADPMARSHFLFQRRTLIGSLAAIILGGLLILINVGVFILFAMAVWTIVRGALGVRALIENRPIRNPTSLFY
jgi:uncharacterized membrane protein